VGLFDVCHEAPAAAPHDDPTPPAPTPAPSAEAPTTGVKIDESTSLFDL
jgi:hypothetical protein